MKISYALYDKRTKTFYDTFYSISVIDRESFKFSKNSWTAYESIEDALKGREIGRASCRERV